MKNNQEELYYLIGLADAKEFNFQDHPTTPEKLKWVSYFKKQIEKKGIEIFEIKDHQFMTEKGLMFIVAESEIGGKWEDKK